MDINMVHCTFKSKEGFAAIEDNLRNIINDTEEIIIVDEVKNKSEQQININHILEKISTKLNVSVEILLENANIKKKINEIKNKISSRDKMKAKSKDREKEIVKKLSREIEYQRNIIERREEMAILRWKPKTRSKRPLKDVFPIVSYTKLLKVEPLADETLTKYSIEIGKIVEDEDTTKPIVEILDTIEPEFKKEKNMFTTFQKTFIENEIDKTDLLQVSSKQLFFYEDDLKTDLLVADMHKIEFNKVENGRVYNKNIVFKNRSKCRLFCKFLRVQANGHSKNTCIDIIPKTNIKFFPAGINKFDLKFSPRHIHQDLFCDLLFLVADDSAARFRAIIPFVARLSKPSYFFSSYTITVQPKAIWDFDKTMDRNKYGKLYITNTSCVYITVRICNVKVCLHPNMKAAIQELQRNIEVLNKSESNKLVSHLFTETSIASKLSTATGVPLTNRGTLGDPFTQTTNSLVDTTTSIARDVLDVCLEVVFEPFYVDRTYAVIAPGKKCMFKFYFINALALGFHQERYNVELWDSADENLIKIEKVIILSETFNLPLRIEPDTLDMRGATVKHGVASATFTIYNDIKVAPVVISLTSDQPKPRIVRFRPMSVSIPAQSSTKFTVSYCIRSLSVAFEEDAVLHFVIQINHKVDLEKYFRSPPFFLQVYAPCNLNTPHFPNIQEIIIK